MKRVESTRLMEDATSSPWAKPAVAAELGKRLRLAALRMNSVIEHQQFPPDFLSQLHQILQLPGKLLGSKASSGQSIVATDRNLWSLAVILSHAAASNTGVPEAPLKSWQAVAPVAAAAEFFGLALDLANDIQDNDGMIVKKLGIPATLNIVLALLGLTYKCLDHPHIPQRVRGPLHSMFTSAMLAATGGQFLDLVYEQREQVTTDESLKMTRQKSGSLIALLFRAGAYVGTFAKIDPEKIAVISDDFARFGNLLGTIAQLENDKQDAMVADSPKSDRIRGKKTLPLIFEAETRATSDMPSEEIVASALRFTQYVVDIYRIQALDMLDQLVALHGVRPGSLRWLIVEREAGS